MPAHHASSMDVDVPPARAKEPRFRLLKFLFGLLLLALVGLGLWKAYELIVQAVGWYEQRKGLVNAVLALTAVAIFVGAVVLMVRSFRERKAEQTPVFSTHPHKKGTPLERDFSQPLQPADIDAPIDPLLPHEHHSSKRGHARPPI